MLFADLLSLHLVTFLMFFVLVSNLHVHVSAMCDYTRKHCSHSEPYQPMDFKFPSFHAFCGVLFVSKVCLLYICRAFISLKWVNL